MKNQDSFNNSKDHLKIADRNFFNGVSINHEPPAAPLIQKPVLNLQATGARIKQLMKQNGITARELQNLMGFQYIQAIYNWTRGENMPTIDNLIVLSEIFGVTINEIVVTDTVEIMLRKSA